MILKTKYKVFSKNRAAKKMLDHYIRHNYCTFFREKDEREQNQLILFHGLFYIKELFFLLNYWDSGKKYLSSSILGTQNYLVNFGKANK